MASRVGAALVRRTVIDFRAVDNGVRLERIVPRALPGSDWVKLRVRCAGICGTDLHLLAPDGSGSPIFRGWFPPVIELGHEIVGEVVESQVPEAPIGALAVVDPLLGCLANGRPLCGSCRVGHPATCEDVDRGPLHGYAIGFADGLGGGWGDEVVVHASQIHLVPDGLAPDVAVLAEPLAVTLHALRRSAPADGPVLIVGGGSVGLLAVVALRARPRPTPTVIVTRHEHQARLAAALGAAVVEDSEDSIEELAARAGTSVRGRGSGATLRGGYSTVIEAAGSRSALSLSARACAPRGTLHLLSAVHRTEIDLAPVWSRELTLVGSFHYGAQPHNGTHDLARALEILAADADEIGRIVSHRVVLDDLCEALTLASDRRGGATKVVLTT